VNLPHWTEPATGEVPRVLGGSSSDEDYGDWSQAGAAGPRFRTGDSDWAEGDWGEGELFKDETMGVAEHGDEHGDPDAWGPPPKKRGGRRGRRGRGERGDAPAEAPPMHTPPPMNRGGLEGPPVPDHFDEYDQHHDQEDGPVDLTPRLITAGVVALIAVVAFAAGRAPAMLLVTAIVGVAALELYSAFQRAGYHPATAVGLLGCVAIVPAAYNEGERAYPLIMILVLTFTCLWYMIEVVRARPIVNIGLTLIPFAWVGIFGGFAGLLLAPEPGGTGLLMGVVIPAVGCDIAAYFVGRSMGRTPLLPRISPNKTVEGLVGGGITAIVLGAMVGAVLHPWADFGIGAGIVLGILVAITAPLGDLVESMIKRDLGVKDLGSFLPGHGGFLDRFDAILFVLPVAFYWAYHLFTTA
jgi:phosphatidate cytidylyltransferase